MIIGENVFLRQRSRQQETAVQGKRRTPGKVQRGCTNPSASYWRKHGLFELLGNFSGVSKWIVKNENKRKVHSKFLLSDLGELL